MVALPDCPVKSAALAILQIDEEFLLHTVGGVLERKERMINLLVIFIALKRGRNNVVLLHILQLTLPLNGR